MHNARWISKQSAGHYKQRNLPYSNYLPMLGMKMKFLSPVLVTGASGFVGSHLAEALSRKKVKVKLLVRRTSQLPFEPMPQMELCYGDVTDYESVRKAVRGVKVVYHLAGILRGSDCNNFKNVNAEGTRNVCRAAECEKGIKRLVYVSSLSAAGPSPAGSSIDETTPCHPVSFYGETKLMGEEIALSYRKKFPVSVLRPAAVYGPRETDIFAYFKMVRQGLVLIPGDGSQQISFIHVTDLVDALLKAAHSSKSVGRVYFVSDGKSYRWEEITALIGKTLKKSYLTIKVPLGIVKIVAIVGDLVGRITGKPSMVNRDKIKEAMVPGWSCSNQKIRKELSFKPKFGIQKGIENTVQFYLSVGWLKP
jgi:nucleoside-diphosphate-sugar epimerase